MRIYKPVEIQFYNKLMDTYRQRYQKVDNSNLCENTENEGETSRSTQSGGEKAQIWSSFEETVEQIKEAQKDKKRRRKRN